MLTHLLLIDKINWDATVAVTIFIFCYVNSRREHAFQHCSWPRNIWNVIFSVYANTLEQADGRVLAIGHRASEDALLPLRQHIGKPAQILAPAWATAKQD